MDSEQLINEARVMIERGEWETAVSHLSISVDTVTDAEIVNETIQQWTAVLKKIEYARQMVPETLPTAQRTYTELSTEADCQNLLGWLALINGTLDKAAQKVSIYDGALPDDLNSWRQQVNDLQSRVEAIQSAVSIKNLPAKRQALQQIASEFGRSDSTVQSIISQIDDEIENYIPSRLHKAKTAVYIDNFEQAESILLEIEMLIPDDVRIQKIRRTIQQRKQIESRIQQAIAASEDLAQSNEQEQALSRLRQEVEYFCNSDVGLSLAVQEHLQTVLDFVVFAGDLAMGQEDHRVFVDTLKHRMEKEDSSNVTWSLVYMLNAWGTLAQEIILRQVLKSTTDIEGLLKIYGRVHVKRDADPSDENLLQEASAKEKLIDRVSIVANEYTAQAEQHMVDNRLQEARESIEALERLYAQINHDFGDEFSGYDDIDRPFHHAKSLAIEIEKQQIVYEQAVPLLDEIEKLLAAGDVVTAKKQMYLLPQEVQMIPFLHQQWITLQEQVDTMRKEQAENDLEEQLSRIRRRILDARTVPALNQLIEETIASFRQIPFFADVTVPEPIRYLNLLNELDKLRQDVDAVEAWMDIGKKGMKDIDGATSVEAFEKALVLNRDGYKRPYIETALKRARDI